MTRNHRFAHRWVWPALALAVGVLFVAALVMRPPPAASASAPLAAQASAPLAAQKQESSAPLDAVAK